MAVLPLFLINIWLLLGNHSFKGCLAALQAVDLVCICCQQHAQCRFVAHSSESPSVQFVEFDRYSVMFLMAKALTERHFYSSRCVKRIIGILLKPVRSLVLEVEHQWWIANLFGSLGSFCIQDALAGVAMLLLTCTSPLAFRASQATQIEHAPIRMSHIWDTLVLHTASDVSVQCCLALCLWWALQLDAGIQCTQHTKEVCANA